MIEQTRFDPTFYWINSLSIVNIYQNHGLTNLNIYRFTLLTILFETSRWCMMFYIGIWFTYTQKSQI